MSLEDNKPLCTGCSACYNICHKQAISMKPDQEGFLYPVIDNKKCINCRQCDQVCPLENTETSPKRFIRCYAAETTNDALHVKSSSGGIFGELAIAILKENGVVFGCAWDHETMTPVHISVENEERLQEIYGSKYLQSNLKQSFKEVKEYLEQKRIVLFSGTPCQITGLKRFLKKDYANLTLVEVICHGVPSPSAFKKYISDLEEEYHSCVLEYSFRHKTKPNEKDDIYIRFKSGKEKTIQWQKDWFFSSFLCNLGLRESCYNCLRKKQDSSADITLGDFWGVGKCYKDWKTNGISAVIVHTGKGMELFKKTKRNISVKDAQHADIVKYNTAYIQSVNRPHLNSIYISILRNRNTFSTPTAKAIIKSSEFGNRIKNYLLAIKRRLAGKK